MPNGHYESLNDLDANQALEAVKKNANIDLAVSKDFTNRSDEKFYDERQKELTGYFDRKEQEFTEVLGQPVFKGGPNDSGFPKDYVETFYVYPDYLVMWTYAGDQYVLSISQEDREFPFVVGFAKMPKKSK